VKWLPTFFNFCLSLSLSLSLSTLSNVTSRLQPFQKDDLSFWILYLTIMVLHIFTNDSFTIFFFVRDKINPRDTWIRWHLGVMSRTFVPPSSAQQRKGRLGIKTSRRYDDVSVLTFQVTVYKISRDLPVKTERTYLGYLCLGVITPRDDMESVWYLLGVISIGCANVSE
jgi:hypothetical protein